MNILASDPTQFSGEHYNLIESEGAIYIPTTLNLYMFKMNILASDPRRFSGENYNLIESEKGPSICPLIDSHPARVQNEHPGY